jgi:hypothetical protein
MSAQDVCEALALSEIGNSVRAVAAEIPNRASCFSQGIAAVKSQDLFIPFMTR